ncbi:hypothetical protein DXG01_007872 [Tephrocybe rancida]|nr:hypothetical protein DXG01_007872 [Tephrocybe rancida]
MLEVVYAMILTHGHRTQRPAPPLNAVQTTKLKHLSIVSLASSRRILPYADPKALDMLTIRDLEDLIIDTIYLDILHGKLDQKEQQLKVEYTMGRDLAELGGNDRICQLRICRLAGFGLSKVNGSPNQQVASAHGVFYDQLSPTYTGPPTLEVPCIVSEPSHLVQACQEGEPWP